MAWLKRFLRGGSPEAAVPSISSVKFDTDAWQPSKATAESMKWTNPDGDTLLARIDALGEHTLPLDDLDALRSLYRGDAADHGGGIVSVDVVHAGQLRLVKVIRKYEVRPAYAYDGRLIVPLKGATCTIEMRSIERGVTGTRDALVTGHLAERGELEIEYPEGGRGVPGRIKGWIQDPYDADWKGLSLYSMSDDDRLDELFPQHPLSKIRSTLTAIRETLSVDPSLVPDRIDRPPSPDYEPLQGARRLLSAAAVGSLYLLAGKFDVAARVLADSVAAAEETGTSDIRVARDLHLLGLAQESMANYVGAERSFSRSSEIFRAIAGAGDIETARALSNLARTYLSLNRYGDAEPLFDRTLKVFQEKDQPGDAAIALNGKGLVRIFQGRHAEAVVYFEQALAIFEKTYGSQFPDCADVLSNMATALQALGQDRKASEALKRARQIQASDGSRSPN